MVIVCSFMAYMTTHVLNSKVDALAQAKNAVATTPVARVTPAAVDETVAAGSCQDTSAAAGAGATTPSVQQLAPVSTVAYQKKSGPTKYTTPAQKQAQAPVANTTNNTTTNNTNDNSVTRTWNWDSFNTRIRDSFNTDNSQNTIGSNNGNVTNSGNVTDSGNITNSGNTTNTDNSQTDNSVNTDNSILKGNTVTIPAL